MDQNPFRVTRYPHGTFSWVDLSSTDAAASKAFLTALMGWSTVDIPLGEAAHEFYTMFTMVGENVAALSQHSPEMMAQGIPSYWNHYITVEDVDALVPRIGELGGQILFGPFDIFDSGRMLAFTDPLGANVSLWQPGTHIGAGLVNCPGALVWNELHTPDRAASQAFYHALLGWQFAPFDAESAEIRNGGRANGALCHGDSQLSAAFWRLYFAVADLDEAAARVAALGGETLGPVEQLDADNRRLLLRDPAGAECGLLELAHPDPWLEEGE